MLNDATIKLVMSTELKQKAQERAKQMNISLNSLIRISIAEYLEKK